MNEGSTLGEFCQPVLEIEKKGEIQRNEAIRGGEMRLEPAGASGKRVSRERASASSRHLIADGLCRPDWFADERGLAMPRLP
jgi:hypothetical protein